MKTGISLAIEVKLGGLFIAAVVVALGITVSAVRRPPPKARSEPRKPVQPQPPRSSAPPAEPTPAPAPDQKPQPEVIVERRSIFSKPETPEERARREAAFERWQRERLPEYEAIIRGGFMRHFRANRAAFEEARRAQAAAVLEELEGETNVNVNA